MCAAHTVPYIESDTAKAQFEHEATTTRLSEDQLFYAMQRGLSQEEAVACWSMVSCAMSCRNCRWNSPLRHRSWWRSPWKVRLVEEMTDYWFRPKRYGYGATPVTWQGWAVTIATVAAMVGVSLYLRLTERSLWTLAALFAFDAIALTFLAISQGSPQDRRRMALWRSG